MPSSVSTNGKTFIKNEEGYRLTVYYDINNHLTVGYGHKVLPADNLKLNDTITIAQADQFFENDVKTVAEDPINKLANVSKMNQTQYDAVASLVYNGGASGVLGSSDMIALLGYELTYLPSYPSGTPQSVIDALYKMVGEAFRYGGSALYARRNREADMFCSNKWYGHTKIV
ncbi:MAG: lysozyme [Firmicutes bacterium]|nr:lysozyme [Bacillota bacterium]